MDKKYDFIFMEALLSFLALAGLLSQKESLKYIYNANVEICAFLSIFISLAIWWYINYLKSDDKGAFIERAALILTILFFLLSQTMDKAKVEKQIMAMHVYNCDLATSTSSGDFAGPDTNRKVINLFLTQTYEQNMGFLLSENSTSTGRSLLEALSYMDAANRLISLNLNIELNNEAKKDIKGQIVNLSLEIKKRICSIIANN